MALTRNGKNVFTNPGTYGGAEALRHGNFIKGGLRNREFGVFGAAFTAYPNGTRGGQSFIQPRSAGSIASYKRARLEIVPAATLTPAMPMTVSGSMTLSVLAADLDQIVALVASGSAAISALTANLSAGVQLVASGTMSLSVDTALLGGIIPVDASSSMTLTPDVVMTAKAFMEASAGGPTALSPEGLAQAVWSSQTSDYNTPGTMGKAVTDAGSAGNPWSAELASNLDAGTFGAHVQKLLTKIFYLGSK